MEDTIGLGPQTGVDIVNLPPPGAELPDTQGEGVATVAASPEDSSPPTNESPQAPPEASAGPAPAPSLNSRRALRMQKSRPEVSGIISSLAAQHGVDPQVLLTLADIESSGDPNQVTGSYKGLFQMSDEEMRRFGGGASAFDPQANTLAAIKSLKAKAFAFEKRHGRQPTVTEFYLGHQQGEGGLAEHLRSPGRAAWESMYATGEGRSKGAGWAKRAIWGNIPDDMKPLFGSVENVTSAQFMAVWVQKVQGIPYQQALAATQNGTAGVGTIYGGPIQADGVVDLKTELAPSFAPPGSKTASVSAQIEAWRPAPTFWQTIEAAADESTASHLFRGSPVFNLDKSYEPTVEELEQRKQGLPEKYWGNLLGVSPAHSDYLTEQARRQFKNEVTLAEGGASGIVASLLVSLADPVDLAVGIASGGLGAVVGGALKAGRLAQRGAAAGGAALGNLASVGMQDAAGRATEGSDYAYAAAWGVGLGFAFGALAKNPATRDIADGGAASAGRASHSLSDPAGDLGAAITTQNTTQFSTGALATMGQDDTSRTAISQLRPDMAGRAGASPNPAVRLLGALFGFDVVGRIGPNGERVVNPQSVGEMAATIRSGWADRVYRTVYPQFDEWVAGQNYRPWERVKGIGRAWHDFADEVYRYRMDPRPDRDLHHSPQAARVDRELTAAYTDHLKGHIDPRFDIPGNPGRPLADMATIAVAAAERYMPRKWRVDKVLDSDATGRRFIDWMEGALLSTNPQLGDKAFTIANGVFRNLLGRAFNVDEFQMMTRHGATAETMRSYMETLGIAAHDIDDIMARLPKGTKPDFAHYKLDLDEHWVHPRTDARITDFVETNAFELFDHYNHQSSAWRALGRAQAVDGQGNSLIDGIRSVPEFEALLAQTRSRGFDAGLTPKQIDDDAALLQEMFDRVRGVPHTLTGGTFDQLLETARNAATAIFGGSFGLSALNDAGRLASLAGIRAMIQHMPSFRQDILDGGVLRPRNMLTRELQAAFAYASEFRPFSMNRAPADDSMSSIGTDMLRNIVGTSRVVADGVLRMSGMPAINRRLRAAASGIMAQRIFDDARRAMTPSGIDLTRLRPAELERMRWFGMDDGMLARVLSQMQQHATSRQGILGEAITGFNPGNWTDPEALNAFANAIRRGANRVSMEHDAVGAGTVFDRSPVFKNFVQLRRFALNAWHMNILHGAHMRDGEVFADVVYSTFMAATLYAVRTRMQAATAEDPERFIEERLSAGAISRAAFQLGAYSSLIPTLVDTFGAAAIGADPVFGFRNSGLPSSAIWGTPTFALTDALAQAPGALLRPIISNRERSKQEWKQLVAPIPFQNNFLVQQGLARMIQDAPARPPRGSNYGISDLIMGSTD